MAIVMKCKYGNATVCIDDCEIVGVSEEEMNLRRAEVHAAVASILSDPVARALLKEKYRKDDEAKGIKQ